jgi:hypothetical protein
MGRDVVRVSLENRPASAEVLIETRNSSVSFRSSSMNLNTSGSVKVRSMR